MKVKCVKHNRRIVFIRNEDIHTFIHRTGDNSKCDSEVLSNGLFNIYLEDKEKELLYRIFGNASYYPFKES